MGKIRALIIEDSEDDVKLILRELDNGSYNIIHQVIADSAGLETALHEEWDVIISDFALHGFNGYEALKICNDKGIDIPFIIVSGNAGARTAVDMMKSGVKDYIMKNNLSRLLPAIERELADIKQRREEKQAIKELKEREERYRSVIQTANDAIITSDSKGKILIWNTGAEKMFGYPESKIIGKPLTLIMPQEYFEQRDKYMNRTESGGETHITGKIVELQGLHKNGNVFPLELSLSEWKTTNGIYYTSIIRDITERKQAEQEIIKAKDKAEEMSRLKTSFLANMSHEIRTPLNGILGFSDVIQDEENLKEVKKMAIIINESGKRLLITLNQLLDL